MKLSPFNITTFIRDAFRHKGAHAVLDQAVISGLNFVTFLMLAKWMTTNAFGGYILTFSVLLFIQTIQHALLTRAHNVLGAKSEGREYRQLTQGVLKLVMVFALSFTLVSLGAGFGLRTLGFQASGTAALALCLVILPWLFQDAVRRILYSSERIASAVINDMVCYGLQVVVIFALLKTDVPGSISLVFAVFGVSSLVAGIIGLVQLRPELSGFFAEKGNLLEVWLRLWNFGKWLTTGEFIGWIGQNGNTWIVGALLGAPLVAGYRAATYVTNLLNPLDLSVSNYLPVKAAHILSAEGHAAMIQWLKKQALILCVPYALVVFGISVGSFWLLDLFFDERYVTELFALILTISAVGRLVGFAANFARLGLMASENNRPIMYSQIISLGVFLTFSIGFITWFGVVGAPLSRIVLHVLLGLYLSITLVKPAKNRPLHLSSVAP